LLWTDAVEEPDAGNEAVLAMAATTGKTSHGSIKYSDIAGAIAGIAFQIDISGAEAALEAARAYE
jgi:methyl-accepting chemotaxis protein